jgi:hypothetical protein
VGVQGSYNRQHTSFTTTIPAYKATSADQYVTILPRLDWYYVRTSFLSVYSGLGIGLSVKRNKYKHVEGTPAEPPAQANETTQKIAAQLNVIGLRVGTRVAGFVEAGYGCNGICQVGVAFQP